MRALSGLSSFQNNLEKCKVSVYSVYASLYSILTDTHQLGDTQMKNLINLAKEVSLFNASTASRADAQQALNKVISLLSQDKIAKLISKLPLRAPAGRLESAETILRATCEMHVK